MAGVEKRDFDSPDETRTPDKTRVDVVRMGGTTAARLTMEPGWSWSSCVKRSLLLRLTGSHAPVALLSPHQPED